MKRRILHVILPILAMLPTTATAQWEELPIYRNRFFDEIFFVDNDYGWIAENRSDMILRTTDGGRTWNESPLPGATGSQLRDLCFVDRNVGFVSGEDGLWKTTDGGRTWKDIRPPSLTGATPAIWFIDRNEGVMGIGDCSTSDVVFGRTTDGGENWEFTPYASTLDAAVGGISSIGGVYHAVGGNGKYWTSTDRGLSWTEANNTAGGWQEDIAVAGATIHAPSTDGNSCIVNGSSARIMTSRDGGRTWTSTVTAPFMLWGVTALSENEAWACGDDGNAYHTTDGGRIWFRRSCGLNSDARIDDIVFTDPTHGWAVGDGIYRFTGNVNVLPVDAGPDRVICAGESVELSATQGAAYFWTPSQGLSCADCRNPIVDATSTTTYTVTVTDADGCAGSDSVTITVIPAPTATVAQDTYTICPGGSVQLSASGGTAFLWQPATGLSDPTAAAPIAAPGSTTSYRVIVGTGLSCFDTTYVTVNVAAPSANLALPDTLADPHQRGYRIPVRLLSPIDVASCPIDSFRVVITLNATLFYPTGVSRGTLSENRIDGSKRRVTISLDRAAIQETAGTLTELIGDVLLGSPSTTPLVIDSIGFNESMAGAGFRAGSLQLSPICENGGERLLTMGNGFGLGRITPNPASGDVTVEIHTVEIGAHALEIYSMTGTRIVATTWETEPSPGETASRTRRITLPTDIAGGIYRIVLRAPGRRDAKPLIIAK